MPARVENVAQDLNNAIYSLASLNPSNVLAGNLNNTWQAWYATARTLLTDVQWWLAFKGFWAAYAAARLSAENLNERTPPASSIDPTLWKTLLSDVQARALLFGDTARQADEAAHEVADMVANKARIPVLFVTGAFVVALLISMGRR